MNKFILKFLWLDKTIAVCLNQQVGSYTTPLTEYFFWPQNDAWESMKKFLNKKKGCINDDEAFFLLNEITSVINDWQQKDKIKEKSIKKIKDKFSDSSFIFCNSCYR